MAGSADIMWATTITYSTLDPSNKGGGVTLSNGNLTAVINISTVLGTVALVGKKYFEVKIDFSPYFSCFGVANNGVTLGNLLGVDLLGWGLYITNFGTPSQGSFHNNGGGAINSNGLNVGDVIGIAYDSSTGGMDAYQNGKLIGTVFTGITGTVYPAISSAVANSTQLTINLGQNPFFGIPPAGYTGVY